MLTLQCCTVISSRSSKSNFHTQSQNILKFLHLRPQVGRATSIYRALKEIALKQCVHKKVTSFWDEMLNEVSMQNINKKNKIQYLNHACCSNNSNFKQISNNNKKSPKELCLHSPKCISHKKNIMVSASLF